MDLIEQIREKVSIVQILECYGIVPKRGRNNYLCFMHEDKHPSAGITKDGRTFHCFSCNCSLSVIDVVTHFENCDVKKAMKIIDDKFHLGIYKPLTDKERAEQLVEMRKREKEKKKKLQLKKLCTDYSNLVIDQLRFWEMVKKDLHITKGEYRRENWGGEDLYFYALKKIDFLNWLYSVLNDVDIEKREISSNDFIYGCDNEEIVNMLKNGDLSI